MVRMLSDKVKKPKDIFALPWDDKDIEQTAKVKPLSKELEAKLEKWDKVKPGTGKRIDPDKALRKLMDNGNNGR